MKNTLLGAFTGKDNATLDLGRVGWAYVLVHLTAIQWWTVAWLHAPMDALSAGGALAAVLAGGGAALGWKASTEPGA